MSQCRLVYFYDCQESSLENLQPHSFKLLEFRQIGILNTTVSCRAFFLLFPSFKEEAYEWEVFDEVGYLLDRFLYVIG